MTQPVPSTIGDCYVNLARISGELLDLHPTAETLAIVSAIAAGSAVADDEAARRQR